MAPFALPSFGSSSVFASALATMGAPMGGPAPAPREQPRASDGLLARAAPAVVAASAAEGTGIKLYTPQFYWACAAGGIASCGLTHMGVTPLDVVKCNMQTNPGKFTGIGSGFATIVREQGPAGLFRGWVPTLLGYSAQGACKFGLYEYFKKCASPARAPAAIAPGRRSPAAPPAGGRPIAAQRRPAGA